MKGSAKFKQVVGKGNVQKGKLKSGRGGMPSRPQRQVTGGQDTALFQYHQKREQPFKGKKRNDRFMDNARPSKKARDNRNFSMYHNQLLMHLLFFWLWLELLYGNGNDFSMPLNF